MTKLRVYLADFFSHKDRVAKYAAELEEFGIEVTARWFNEQVPHNVTMKDLPDEYHRETAAADIEDIFKADVLVLFTGTDEDYASIPPSAGARGGRHFETGFMYGLNWCDSCSSKGVIICGRKENIFHHLDGEGATGHLPFMEHFATWEETKRELQLMVLHREKVASAKESGTRVVA